MDIVTYALCKKFTKKSLAGLGALRGSPCKVKSIQPVYSTEDPSVVIKNIVTLQWDSNESRDPSAQPMWHEERIDVLDNGRGIHDIEYVPELSTAAYNWYKVTFYDGTTDDFKIPASSGSMKKKVVAVLPSAAAADKNTIYLVPIESTPDEYQQWLVVENDVTGAWEWLSLGTTSVNLDEYQLKIDPLISKSYMNYDPKTKAEKPTAKNVVGAINTFEKEIGGNYNDATGKIANLKTLHQNNLVDAVNEIGYLPDLEMYSELTGKPDNLVDAINLANKDYSLDKQTTVDKTKFIDEFKMILDAKDGSAKVQVGDTVDIPRTDVKLQGTPTSDANYVDYRTYNVLVGNEPNDPNDAAAVPYGAIHIPQIKIAKKLPTDTTTRTDTLTVAAGDTTATLAAMPAIDAADNPMITSVKTSAGVAIPFTAVANDKTITFVSPITAAQAGEIKVVYEVTTLAAQYYLDIESKGYSLGRCGFTIDIAKNQLFKDIIIVTNTADNVPVPGLLKDEKAIAFIFEDASGTEKTTYLPVKDLIKMYEGKEAIEIDDTSDPEKNFIKLKIYDPDTIGALIQDDNGVQILKATTTQYGVVMYATEAEILAPAAAIEKSVKPYDLYKFATASDSVKDDIGNLYKDADGNIINNTITKAISELSTIKVKEKAAAAVDEKNITEYNVEDIPAVGVENFLGQTIEIPKSIRTVEALTTVADPKDYFLYYLTQDNNPYKPGLYKYVGTEWVKVSGGAIEYVETLPAAADAEEDHFYGIANTDTVEARYNLSIAAKEAGYTISENGLTDPLGNTLTWASVYASWSSFVDDELVVDADGPLYIVRAADNSKRLEYGYEEFDLKLFFFKNGEKYQAYEMPIITLPMIDDLFIED